MTFRSLRGTTDVLADDVTRWIAVEHTARRLARLYGYHEIRTPLIEDSALFLRSIGETTDIVQKEMFRFEDRGGQEIVLRPEGTASVVRAYLEHHLHKTQGFAKLFYLGPMFRAERPQAGRYRQFHQYGVEAIGSESPWVDVEVVTLCLRILQACGVMETSLWIASMGCRDDQQRSAAALRQRLRPHRSRLCPECQRRCEKNVFRVLDCKHPTCHEIACLPAPPAGGAQAGQQRTSPFLLCDECAAHFEEVRRGLRESGVRCDETQVFARGLDYYTRTVFEVRAKGLGAQDAVAAGGRYDHLVEELGGPPMGAVGFAAGIERLLLAQAAPPVGGAPDATRRGVYLAVAQPALIREGYRMSQTLRERGISTLIAYDGKSLKAQLREADKTGCRYVAILGEAELKEGTVTVKDLTQAQADQRTVPLDQFIQDISQHG